MKIGITAACSILSMLCPAFSADHSSPPAPALCEKGELIYAADFSDGKMPTEWVPAHGTQWAVVDGVLVGKPSSAEYQEKRKLAGKTKHLGGTPASSIMVPMQDGLLQLSFMISGKMNAAHFGTNDGSFKSGTGHVMRFTASTKDGLELIKDDDSTIPDDEDEVLDRSDFKIQSDVWYTVLLEFKGGECVAQITGGPTLRGTREARFNRKKTRINLPTRGGGTIHYDDIKIWAAK